MHRLTGFADLTDKRVGIFGYGIEGRASERRVRPLADSLVLVDDEPPTPAVLATSGGGFEQLLTCDVVLKSPGIPRRRGDVLDLERHGVAVVSALNLWLHDIDRSRVIAITGTKGKSTTTALVTFFLQCLGEQAQRLGNIGQPPYDPSVDTTSGWLVLEVSSFQCTDIDVAPGLVVVTSLGADHLDWHGSLAKYRSDKLSLTRTDGEHVTMVPEQLIFREMRDQLGGDVVYVEPDDAGLSASLGLLGAHSASNVALALRVVAALTLTPIEDIRDRIDAHAHEFIPLRGRLTLVAHVASGRGTLRYVDDGLATSVLPTLAALEVFRDEPVALLAGGFDRGVDYTPLARALAQRVSRTALLTMGEAGRRIGEVTLATAPQLPQHHCDSMLEAVTQAKAMLRGEGVVLLSPAAPSFDAYHNWEERSEDFTRVVRAITHT
ncbi:MAG: UDP-N-acetylmuramoyl-L-alanine--D-glutamate ligase [Acidimicrobiales bacterium]